ncbi:efflux RND transporter periplasmic adaptor subunit [Schlesneria sp.]|uniref:efflux RND transporter periplasmic adaptor subunit n=1 Tax=Schlesneria sp. TaxID=2762018 RepID=UPI002F0B1978
MSTSTPVPTAPTPPESPAAMVNPPPQPVSQTEQPVTSEQSVVNATAPVTTETNKSSRLRTWFSRLAILMGIAVLGYLAKPRIELALNTVSTDDAYVNGHVTFVTPRVAGQVNRVLVDDNYRVKKGDLLVQLDPEPYQIQVNIRKAAVEVAESDLAVAMAQVKGRVGQIRSYRFSLDHTMENVQNQIAQLRANVDQLKAEQADLELAEKDYARNKPLAEKGTIAAQNLDTYKAHVDIARNRVANARDLVQQTRVGLGLPINHENPLDVPGGLDQNFSLVRQALGSLVQEAAQFGYTPSSWTLSPKQMIDEFLRQDPEGNLDHIFSKLITEAPAIKQAEAKLEQARRDLDKAELDLRYCNVVSEIDGVVARRNVNPGNNVQAGQSLLTVRSLDEIWIDANFKETQLADLRIGQRVKCEVDMYGKRNEFTGRITGFTMGTGQTLALLPPQNATGNFVKIVQRLPVRIELTDYNPEKLPLFTGLSVVPYVYFKEPATGPNAGKFLQPRTELPPAESMASAESQTFSVAK